MTDQELIEQTIRDNPWMENFRDDIRIKCSDCGVRIGEEHVAGCDHTRCTKCGSQWIMCGCKDGEHDIHNGLMMPDLHRICVEDDLWCRDIACFDGHENAISSSEMLNLCLDLQMAHVPGFRVRYHVPCGKNDVGAHADLNKAAMAGKKRLREVKKEKWQS